MTGAGYKWEVINEEGNSARQRLRFLRLSPRGAHGAHILATQRNEEREDDLHARGIIVGSEDDCEASVI